MNSRTLVILGLVLAGLCLVRVLSVAAATRDRNDDADVEVYSSTEKSGDEGNSRSSSDDENRPEIRLSRPEEAEERIADDKGFDLVPGAERLQNREIAENTLIVPTRQGRKIASEPARPEVAEQSPIEVRPEAVSAQPTRGALSAAPLANDVMEPKPFTSADARDRAVESRRETIVASNRQLGRPAFGIHSEPEPETKVDPPVPASAMSSRAGVQEVSLIVSDYGYFPSRIFVTQNVPVKIYLTTPSKVTMCFMLDTWGLKKGILPGKVEEITFVPQAPGNYRFYCPVKSIEGTLTVREAPVAEQSGRGVASAPPPPPDAGKGNEPKRAAELRSLIED